VDHQPTEILRLLELEELDTDLYRARNPAVDEGMSLFGGQVAAQALLAAGLTVPAGRFPHSMHGYFLRAGQWERPIILHVDRDRDGRSYSARHVVARQNGEAIFTLSASFHLPDDPAVTTRPMPALGNTAMTDGVPAPEDVDAATELTLLRPMIGAFFDIRPVPHPQRRQLPSRFWARTRVALPEDPLVHVCALTYLSDFGSGFGPFMPTHFTGGPSLDHALWFHRPARLDDWLLVDLRPAAADGARGVYTGSMHDRSGNLLATVAQQHILRDGGSTPW
jgi:acyl-CoA thioesterase-2